MVGGVSCTERKLIVRELRVEPEMAGWESVLACERSRRGESVL